MVSPVEYRRLLAWICGWAYSLGNITITLSVNFGTALFFIGSISIFRTPDGDGIFTASDYQTYSIFFAFTVISNRISALGNRWLPLLDVSTTILLLMLWTSSNSMLQTAAMYITFAAVISIICSVLAIANEGRHNATYAFTAFEPNSGWTPGWSFMIGLLHAAYANSATGMVIS